MKKRTMRTPAQRLEEAQREVARLSDGIRKDAVLLAQRADGWEARADQLRAKAQDAREAADLKLESAGIDPATFWQEEQQA
jgi:hypothetical protein